MHSDQVIDDFIHIGPGVVDDGVGIRLVSAHVHAGLYSADQRVAFVLQVRLGDSTLQCTESFLRCLQSLILLGEAEAEMLRI